MERKKFRSSRDKPRARRGEAHLRVVVEPHAPDRRHQVVDRCGGLGLLAVKRSRDVVDVHNAGAAAGSEELALHRERMWSEAIEKSAR